MSLGAMLCSEAVSRLRNSEMEYLIIRAFSSFYSFYILLHSIIVGVDKSLSSGVGEGAMFAAFTASSFVGSSVGCVMSLAEEYESAVSTASNETGTACTIDGNFSTQSALMSVLPPAAVALFVSTGGDEAFTAPLHLSGAVIAPFLYGLLPIMLLKRVQDEHKVNDIPRLLLGVSTCGLLGTELVQDCANWLS